MGPQEAIEAWPVTTVAAGWRAADDAPTSIGAASHVLSLASVTKPLVALAVLVAVEEGSLALDHQVGPPGATVAHLLAHASGLAPEDTENATLSRLATRRIYSNHGYEELGRAIEDATELDMATYLKEAILDPLGMADTYLAGSPAHGAFSSVDDLLKLGAELLRPTLLSGETMAMATSVQFGDLTGVLPGFGRQSPNPWGLGFEIKGHKTPHWTGATNSPDTYGHFGRSGTFFWVDPALDLFCVALTDRTFGPWAAESWTFSDLVIQTNSSD
jgi:CubicO group peptidase (beta-lactamase class C family)